MHTREVQLSLLHQSTNGCQAFKFLKKEAKQGWHTVWQHLLLLSVVVVVVEVVVVEEEEVEEEEVD